MHPTPPVTHSHVILLLVQTLYEQLKREGSHIINQQPLSGTIT